ncbi:polysaccharide pyruvyl transferase family protein [uncultured Rothia sp.]|uniref:polysaccharide pyruvyl transferase family protein n=1 Tax=uncultured Rothia sp. TaxID=316088 RepID=UPI0032165B4B
MKILVLSDLGQPVYHVGDEAMGIAAADEMTARGHKVVFATRSAEHSQQMIGTGAGYIPTLEFPWPPAEREVFLDDLRRYLFHEERSDPASEQQLRFDRFVADVSSVDAVLIAGGGNMNSRYGWLLYERAALAMTARFLGKPLVVSGQSVGPVLTEHDAHILTELLNSAQLVGMREQTSQTWCAERGIVSTAGIDDAVFYRPQQRTLAGSPTFENFPEGDYLSVTLNGLSEKQTERIAALLDRIFVSTGLRSVFVPHMGNPEFQDGDVHTHSAVAALMESPTTVVPLVHADQAAELHRRASIVLTTRYHPAVLAMAYGVPAMGLIPDAFTDIRLSGALAHFGLEDFAIPLALLTAESTFEAFSELVERRSYLSEQLRPRGEQLREFESKWWDDVAATFAGERVSPEGVSRADSLSSAGRSQENSGWQKFNSEIRAEFSALSLEAHQAEANLDRALTWDAVHVRERDEFRSSTEALNAARRRGVQGYLRRVNTARRVILNRLFRR